MPKKSIEINPFDGGLNDFADARDIEEKELAAATNINTDQPGRIKIGKRVVNVATRTGPAGITTGKGVFQFSSDYNASNALVPTEYQLLYYNNTLYRRSLADTNFSSISSLGVAYDPDFFSLDGNIRFSDGNLSSDTKFVGVTDVDNFGVGQSPALTITNAYIDPPTDGDLTKDPADATDVPSSQTDNFIDLIVQKKVGTTEDWFNFDFGTNDGDTAITGLYNHAQNGATTITESNVSGYSSYVNTSVTLHGVTSVNAVSGKCFRVEKDSTSINYSEAKIGFVSTKNFEDKSVYIDVYVPTATKSALDQTIFTVEIGNSADDHYTYKIGSAAVAADEWVTLEFQYGQHDDMDGSPNAVSIDFFKITAHHQNNSDTHDWAIDNLKIGESSRGTWNGRYKFYYSWIYDRVQESIPFLFNGQSSVYEVEGKILQFRSHLKLTSSPGANDRITGANIYFVEFDLDDNPLDTDKKLLLEIDIEKGIKKVDGETFEAWGAAKGSGTGYEAPQNSGHTAFTQIFDPPSLETFSTKAGYDESDKLKKMKYKTSVVTNRRSYVGNVKVTDQNDKERTYTDRIYKSEPNNPDVFTENGYVDVAINDGESITALASLGDMLLQFKESTMYLINCTQEIEYLEESSKFRGVWGDAAVCETDSGIAWANDYGLFLFTGKEVISLIDKKINPDNWNSVIGSKPMVAFAPLQRSIFIVGDADNPSNGYTYSLRSEGFNYINGNASTNLFTADMTNLTSSKNGVLSWYEDNGTDVIEKKWDTATGDVYIDIKTRDQDFKDPARRKMVKNIYITYKLSEDEEGTSIPTIKYLTNGGSTEYAFNAALQKNHSDWYTQVLKPNVSSEANNVYSFQVRIHGDTFEGFEINDINVVYRDKVLK